MDGKRKKILIIGGIVTLVVLICAIFTANYFISNTLDNLNFEVIAEKIEQGEVLTDTNFIIKSEKNYAKGIMKKIVSIEPEIEYTLDKTAKGTYLVTPKEKLDDSSIYNVYINVDENKPALSWAFQTKEEFKVISTLPSEDTAGVETNTAITVNFSKPVEDIENYFEISPKVEGRFEYSNKKVSFVPDEILSEDTVYKVLIKKGLKSYFNDEFIEDYTFSFRAASDKPYFYLINGYQETVKPTEVPKILVSSGDIYKTATFNIKAYKLNSVQEYATYLETHYKNIEEAIGNDYDHNFDMTNHTEVFSYSTNLIETEDLWQEYLMLPDKLPIGWYIIDITNSINELHIQKALQVSDISVYTYGLNGDIRIWLNDSDSGELLTGATVQLGGLASISNKDGLASFNVATDEKQKLIITTKDGREFGEYIKVTNIEESRLEDDYYMYVYTDRKQYLPTDTINYWGVIIPRKTGVEKPAEVEIITDSDIKQTAKVDEHGAFSGSINIVSHESAWKYIGLRVGEREKNYLNEFLISDYTKPVYKITSDFSKDYYKKGEKIELNVYGKFYDGTSAENVKVKVSTRNDEYKIVTLNANGEAKATLNPYTDDDSGEISYIGVDLEIAGIDEYASAYNSTYYIPTDYHIEGSWDENNKQLILSTNKINCNAINSRNVDYSTIYTGESFPQDVYLEVVESRTEKRYTGETEYNEYSGTFYPKYVYDRVENIVGTYNLTIPKDEKLKVDVPLVGENENATYSIKINYTYPDGFTGNKSIYAWQRGNYVDEYKYFSADKVYLKENETAKLTLTAESVKSARMLYIVSTDRINKMGVTTDDELEVKMTKELIPNCIVSGAFFDGKTIYKIGNANLSFNSEDRELNIDIKTDKETYRPGEKVKAVAKVTDINGEPVQCNFLFSVVDEAALFDSYEEDILYKIYEPREYFPITFTSDAYECYGGDGGGGGDEIRDTFADVLAFKSLYTDKNGEANIEFAVSDDLTSWRITGIAVSNDIKAGKAIKNITTSIPFFVNQVVSKKYTVNDDISFSARVAANGIALLSSSNISYNAKLFTNDGKLVRTDTKEANPSDTVIFNFGKIDAGKYRLRISASSGDNKDEIEKEIEVIESLHEISLAKEINISEIENLNVIKYPMRLMMFDRNNSLYYKTLAKILEKSNGGTNEQAVAKNYTYKKLNEFYGKELYNTDFNTVLQEYDGGARKLESEEDALFTAQVIANADEYLNSASAEQYFYRIIDDNSSSANDVTAAYMGLAALKAPVLTDIKYLLENNNGLEVLDKINLIDALAYIGDYKSATEYYEKEIKPIMTTTADSKSISPEYETLYYQATSRILPALSLTGHEDFEAVLKYILENDTDEYIPVMDLISFVSRYNPTEKCKSKITYTLDGEKVNVDFSKEKIRILELNKAQFDTFKVEKIKGEVNAIVEYIGNVSDIDKNDESIKIIKTISEGELGEYSTVTLDIHFSDTKEGDYILDDVVPTSSRYVSTVSNTDNYYLSQQEGQRVKFRIYPREKNNITITYKIRNIFSGEFGAEQAYITNRTGKVFGLGNNNLLTFKVK